MRKYVRAIPEDTARPLKLRIILLLLESAVPAALAFDDAHPPAAHSAAPVPAFHNCLLPCRGAVVSAMPSTTWQLPPVSGGAASLEARTARAPPRPITPKIGAPACQGATLARLGSAQGCGRHQTRRVCTQAVAAEEAGGGSQGRERVVLPPMPASSRKYASVTPSPPWRAMACFPK